MWPLTAITAVLGGLGVYLMLRAVQPAYRRAGGVFAGAALACLTLLLAGTLGGLGVGLFFYLLAVPAVVSAFMVVTSRKPIHSALWFGLVLLSTAGLFLLIGAQFVAAATIVVYAGAILVTLLFVIMLAQQAGAAAYDRQASDPFWSALVAAVIAGFLMFCVVTAQQRGSLTLTETADVEERNPEASTVATQPRVGTVADLGLVLFTEHLLSVEVAGTLLLVALVAAVCITGPKE